MKNIWVVIGGTGDYSEYTEWLVCGYPSEGEAQKHCDALQAVALSVARMPDSERQSYKTPLDPQFSIDSATLYSIQMVEVKETFCL